MENNNEVKRTQGEWRRNGSEIVSGSYPENPYKVIGAIYYEGSTNQEPMKYEEAEANAEFICKAVNEYDSLIEDNKRLLEVLKELDSAYDVYAPDLGITNGLMKKVDEAINKSENKI